MERIVIVGPSGAGKSTFSRKLNSITGIPLYPLDNIWWNSDKTHITREEFDSKLKDILLKDKWIIDGDYSRTYEIRMEYADTIIFLDYPLSVCLEGVQARIGKKRLDIPWVEEEFDPEFKEWIIGWFNKTLPLVNQLLEKYKDNKVIYRFHSRDEANKFLKDLGYTQID